MCDELFAHCLYDSSCARYRTKPCKTTVNVAYDQPPRSALL